MNEAVEFVAEHIMGLERRYCQGAHGGGDSISGGGYGTWTWCDWCGREIPDGTAGPCPRYPFPRFSMCDLMRRLGDVGHHIMIRFDPQRERDKFTICLDGQRICDTDGPLEALCERIVQIYTPSEPIADGAG